MKTILTRKIKTETLTLKLNFLCREGTKIFWSLCSYNNEPNNAQFSFLLANAVALATELIRTTNGNCGHVQTNKI